jgi:hypothetical protein
VRKKGKSNSGREVDARVGWKHGYVRKIGSVIMGATSAPSVLIKTYMKLILS